jgi:hypothetical protein
VLASISESDDDMAQVQTNLVVDLEELGALAGELSGID